MWKINKSWRKARLLMSVQSCGSVHFVCLWREGERQWRIFIRREQTLRMVGPGLLVEQLPGPPGIIWSIYIYRRQAFIVIRHNIIFFNIHGFIRRLVCIIILSHEKLWSNVDTKSSNLFSLLAEWYSHITICFWRDIFGCLQFSISHTQSVTQLFPPVPFHGTINPWI